MVSKTGRALGSLDPVLYFEMRREDGPQPKGHVMLAPQEIGHGPELAREIFENRYKPQGYEWREAGTLAEVDRLQKRLGEQEMSIRRRQGEVDERAREEIHRQTAANLRQRMASSSCTPYERDFIGLWLQLQEEKRTKYTQRWTEYTDYIWAREQNSSTKVEDRMA